LAPLRPPGELTLGRVSAEQYRYFLVRDLADEVRDRVRDLAAEAEEVRLARFGLPSFRRPDSPRQGRKWRFCRNDFPGMVLREMASALDINEYLKELAESATAAPGPQATELQMLLANVALLHLIAESVRSPTTERAVLWPVGLGIGRSSGAAERLLDRYATYLPVLRLELADAGATPLSERCLVLRGPHALTIARQEAGIHLRCPAHGAVEPVVVLALPVEEQDEPIDVVRSWTARRQSWLEALARGEVSPADDPLNPGPVLRLYPEQKPMVDLRTGLIDANLDACLLAALPLPPELSNETSRE
jgi:hypothetical protein